MNQTIAELKEQLSQQMDVLKTDADDGTYAFKSKNDEQEFNRLWNLNFELTYFINEYLA